MSKNKLNESQLLRMRQLAGLNPLNEITNMVSGAMEAAGGVTGLAGKALGGVATAAGEAAGNALFGDDEEPSGKRDKEYEMSREELDVLTKGIEILSDLVKAAGVELEEEEAEEEPEEEEEMTEEPMEEPMTEPEPVAEEPPAEAPAEEEEAILQEIINILKRDKRNK